MSTLRVCLISGLARIFRMQESRILVRDGRRAHPALDQGESGERAMTPIFAVAKGSSTPPRAGVEAAAALLRSAAISADGLQHLVSALEGGASAPAAILKAVSDREKAIAQLEGQIRCAAKPRATPGRR